MLYRKGDEREREEFAFAGSIMMIEPAWRFINFEITNNSSRGCVIIRGQCKDY